MTLPDHDLDQSENSNNTTMAVHNSAHNQNGLATGQSQPNFHGQFITNVLFTVADFSLVPNGWKLCANPFIQPNAIIGGSYPSPSGAYTYQNTGTTVHGLSNNASADQALSSSVATPANTGSSSRIPVSPGATNHGKAHARVQYPPSKYGFGPVLVAKNMIEKGDELKIPLNLGANLTLPNPDYVIMEYLGRNREGKNATASDWILRTSPSVNCTAKGPKSFIKILNDNGIVGYNTRNLSATAEVVRNGRSLGTITEMKARANGG